MVDDTVIAGVKMKTTDVMRRLRGPKGTEVRVKVQRGGSPKLIEFKIIRGKIPVHSLDAAYMADSTTGYIRLNRFANTSHEEFLEALTRLRKEGMKHLVLDLQGNGGGYLHVACNLADEFLSNGRLIVYTEGRNSPREEATATATGNFEDGRLVILVDESSASASEIVSGAVQDWDRGVIVGRRTFGKGLVQRPIPLPDNSMIRLTIARYYTPGGRNIQKPYTGGDAAAYNRDLIDRYNHGELMNADSIHFPDSLRSRTLVNHRTVYGGGGIMPDRFIPLDTSRYTDYHRRLVGLGYIYRTVLSYVDGHRKALRKRYPDFKSFSQQFTVGDDGDALIRHYRRALDANEAVLSFGGIGATPDDRTRQAVAAACDVPLAYHPEGDALLRAKYGEDEYTAARRELIHFPQGASLIPNPVNGIPGFSLRGIHCVPGFPQMAEPMMQWVLDHDYRYLSRERCYLALDVFAPESRLSPIMQILEERHPQVAVSSLPKLHFESELGFDGSRADCEAAIATARRLLDEAEMQWQGHE